MGTNTLPNRLDGVPMPASWFNDIRSSLLLDHVPRNASGIPTDEAGSLGDSNYQWDNIRAKSLYIDGSLVDTGAITGKPHRINSAKQDATTKYPEFLSPAGVGNGLSCELLATATEFNANINNVDTTVSADTTFSSLTAAPAANNTCLINDVDLTGADSSKTLGELDSQPITIDNIGAEITAVKGEMHAFLTGSEVFLALVDTDNNKLFPIYRGWATTDRATLSNNATITLLSVNALLIKNDGSTKVSSVYFPESVTVSPAAGTAGKIYIERSTNKIGYDTGAAIDYDYMIAGYAVCDDTDCTHAQIYDLELHWDDTAKVEMVINTASAMTVRHGSIVSINGVDISFYNDYEMTKSANMDAGEAISNDTLFNVYINESGTTFFSTVDPRKYDSLKKGMYHPKKYFRCIGGVITDAVGNFIFQRNGRKTLESIRDEMVPVGSVLAFVGKSYPDNANTNSGSSGVILSISSLKYALPDAWRVMDGTEIYDPEAPKYNKVDQHIANLTGDIFLMGDTTYNIGDSVVPAHNHTLDDTGFANAYFDLGSTTIATRSAVMPIAFTATRKHIAVSHASDTRTLGYAVTLSGVTGDPVTALETRPKWFTCFYIEKIK